MFDRAKKGVSKSQVGFYDIVALPLFIAYTRVFPGLSPMLSALKANYAYWKEQEGMHLEHKPASSELNQSSKTKGGM